MLEIDLTDGGDQPQVSLGELIHAGLHAAQQANVLPHPDERPIRLERALGQGYGPRATGGGPEHQRGARIDVENAR